MDRILKLKSFLTDSPDDSFIKHALALEYVKKGDDNQARELFENILQKDENYIGSYYHLCKVLERMDEQQEAIKWCELGMQKAKANGDNHAYNELLSIYEDLTDQ